MSESQDVRALLARAVVELKDMRRRVEAAERAQREPIAIVGMACRFPGGADSPEGFWRLLERGADTVTEVPAERWDVDAYYDPRPGAPGKTHVRWGSFLPNVYDFEPAFFDLSPREAASMDPQQRLLLEVAYHALEDAGLPPERVRGGRGGVFVGVCNTDFQHVMFEHIARADTHSATGVLTCVLSGRVSYAFDLRGPSVPVDTGCSASLVAVHLAVQSLRTGESDVALAGGVNLLLSPLSNVLIARLQALSPDGRCKTLDAGANGFARGEGCGVVVLKRLSKALADGDRVYAVIRGSAVNQDGKTSGLTAPNVLAQQAVIRAALENAGVAPAEVGFVELHGTGTPLGDPIEVEALREVYGAPRPDGSPCALGAVKTNVGHTESAAGVAGLIKAVLTLRRGAVPRNVHFRELNPRIDLEGTPFVVPRETTPWPAGGKRRRAGVSSFGIGGTNAHVIVEETELAPKADAGEGPGPYLLPVSARSRESLAATARAYAEALRGGLAGESLRDVCFTASVRRPHYEYRFAAVGATAAELAEQLAAADPAAGREAGPAAARRVVFLFSGQGSQSVGMVRAVLEAEPAFRASMEACDAAVRAEVGWSVLAALADDDARLDKTPIVQPILFSIQVSLAALFRARGVVPDAVIGQSMGEVAAAHVAGALSLADAARIICRRSALMQKVEGRGLMALAEIGPAEAEAMIAGRERAIAIGSYLGPKSVVFAGESEPVREVQRALEARGVFCRLLKVDTPSHCPVVDGLMDELHGLLAGLRPVAGAVPMYSTVTGELVDGERLTPAYWARNLRDQVRLMPAVERAIADGHDVFVEISPHPVILPSIGQIAGARGAEVTALPALRRDEERGAFAATLGTLYELGRPVDFASLYPAGGLVVSLPGYVWQRERYELALGKGRARPIQTGGHDLLGERLPVAAERETYVWPVELSLEAAPYLTDHRVLGSVVVPGALYIDLALSAGAQIFGQVSLEDVVFERVLPLPEDGARQAQITLTVLDAERASFTVATLYDAEGGARPTWTRHASGTIVAGRVTASAPRPIAEIRARANRRVEGEAYYRFTSSLGIQLGPLFRGVERLECNDAEGLATIRLAEPVSAMLSRYTLHPAFLDIVFQAMGGPISGTGLRVAAGDTCLPVRLARLRVHEPVRAGQRVYSHASVRPAQQAGSYLADLVLLADDGRALIEVEGLLLEPVNGVGAKSARGAAPADPIDALTYGLEWVEAPRAERRAAPGDWLIAGASGPAAELVAALGARGQRAIALPEGADLGAHALPSPAQPLSLVYLASASADVEQALADDRPAADVEAVTRWVRAVSKAGLRQAPRLFLVTFEARRVVELDTAKGLAQAPLLGLGATLRHEHAELRATCVDVARAGVAALADELVGADDETELALRESRWALRLVRAPLAPSASPKAPVRPDGTYLITGGLTGIGLTVARWLAEQGARDLVLVARRAPSPEARAVIDAIAGRGARVHVRACDVTDRAAVSALFGEVRRELPPLRGVAHCAVVLDDATLLNLDGERLRKVMAPKVAGAWNLHRETRALDLDFFHLYSSVASLFGSPGQGNYAAGSAFLDALAHHRRAAGLPATAINWGPWAEIGLAAADEKRGERVAGRGAASLTPELGLAALGRLLAAEAPPQVGLLSFDLRQWAEFYPAAARTPLFARLRDEAGSAPAAHAALRDELLAAPAPLRKGLLEKHLSEQVGRVLRMPLSRVQRQKAFNTMGVDSLMALEIRNRLEGSLGLTLPAILLYAHPSVAALAAHLLTLLEPAGPASAPPALAPASPAAGDAAAPAVEAMTDEQAEAALLTQLAALGMKTAP